MDTCQKVYFASVELVGPPWGSFTYYVISRGGGGGFQMLTVDYGGGGGGGFGR